MYSFMLQAAEERLHKKHAKASEEEVAPSSSAPAMTIDDPPPVAPSLASTSFTCTTTSPSRSSSPSSIAATVGMPEEPLLSSSPWNPSLPIVPTTSAGDGAAVMTTDAPPSLPIPFIVSSMAFPTTSLDASSSPDLPPSLETTSASNAPPPPSSFSFETNVLHEDKPPSLSPVPTLQETDMLSSSSPPPLEPSPISPPHQESITFS